MSLFRKNKDTPYTEQHLEQAEELIKSARVYATGTFISWIDECPQLQSVTDSNLLAFWDYLITIACIGTAFAEIVDTVPEKDQPRICYAIQKKLNDWNSDSYDAMTNFLLYAKKLIDKGVELPDAIGSWVWVNIEKHELSNLELKELASSLRLVRAVGLPIMITFHNWCKQK
ncbi:MAG: hypothetical protein AAB151_02030 [Nitrospirota bacterium]